MRITLKKMEGEKLALWVNCLREECGEGKKGYCTHGYYEYGEKKQDFPTDGRCLYPGFYEYDNEFAELGAYEEAI